ncbi:hypothetical protein FJR38_10515 [Anabaena sp. UHCC 0253]|nr:hypothetical protein [Anabaena sp. UHCC 0253]
MEASAFGVRAKHSENKLGKKPIINRPNASPLLGKKPIINRPNASPLLGQNRKNTNCNCLYRFIYPSEDVINNLLVI